MLLNKNDAQIKTRLMNIAPQMINTPRYADEIKVIFTEQFEDLGVEVTTCH